MTCAAAFLHGVYRQRDLPYYRNLCKGRLTLAVDGGYSFFRKAGMPPDVLIGDFDSLKRVPKNLPISTRVLQFPPQKDRTDAHLAVHYCLEQGIRDIDIVMPGCGDMDHAIGSILLLGLVELHSGRYGRPAVRVVNRAYEVRLVADGELVFRRCHGDVLSVLPLSDRVRLTTTGTEYDVAEATIRFGESRGLRNRIVRTKATVRVKGKALVIHRYSR